MKRKTKKLLISCLALSFISFCGFNTNHVKAFETEDINVGKEFIEYVTDTFTHEDKVTVIDFNGNNITNNYFSANVNHYLNNDFKSIKIYFINCIDNIYIDESNENINTRSPFVTQTVSKRYYKVVNKEQASGELEYYLNGSFIWDRATGLISSVGNASINITYNNFGTNWNKIVSNMTTSSSMSSDKCYAYFSGGFNLRVTFKKYLVEWYNIDLGRFTGNTTEHPQG